MSSDQPTVGFTRTVPGTPEIQGVCVKTLGDAKATQDQILGFVPGLDALVTMYTDPVDDALLEAAGKQLKIICNFAVGYDNIDISACKNRGIIVCNTPDAVTEGTANLAWLLIMATARRLIEAHQYAISDTYPANGHLGMHEFLGMDLCNKVIHIVGAGRIGYATALRAKAFGMRIIYTARSRHIDFEMTPLGATRVTFEDGLAQADVVSIHTPFTPQTRHLINRGNLKLLKPTAILVNTSRGPVIDESALVDALAAGKLWGAGLDVYENEPVVHPGLLTLNNVTLTPHIGSAEIAWREAMTEMVLTNIKAALAGQESPNRIA
ncbi:MAG: D-glycerate dehydrogenase [Phycisphaerales bacterium]|nr:D-glycerate dehydrogenase [Phycisphaerales bacterium]